MSANSNDSPVDGQGYSWRFWQRWLVTVRGACGTARRPRFDIPLVFPTQEQLLALRDTIVVELGIIAVATQRRLFNESIVIDFNIAQVHHALSDVLMEN
jgi:hypothetical protein